MIPVDVPLACPARQLSAYATAVGAAAAGHGYIMSRLRVADISGAQRHMKCVVRKGCWSPRRADAGPVRRY